MRESFISIKLREENWQKLQLISDIIDDYEAQGYRLTLRQLYYQLVSRDIVPNIPSEYAKLSTLMVKARMGGAIDWSAIEDRIRVPRLPYYYDDVQDALTDTAKNYRLDRMAGQENYIEIWCEKDALSGIIATVTERYHIRLMINRGYSSASAMYRASKRLQRAQDDNSQATFILYLGDHDPSGLDMVRDIGNRLMEFGIDELSVEHLALTEEQIDVYNPPPNPAKISDPRAEDYIAAHGNESWEVDALEPKVLTSVVEDRVLELIDEDLYIEQLGQESDDKLLLSQFARDEKAFG